MKRKITGKQLLTTAVVCVTAALAALLQPSAAETGHQTEEPLSDEFFAEENQFTGEEDLPNISGYPEELIPENESEIPVEDDAYEEAAEYEIYDEYFSEPETDGLIEDFEEDSLMEELPLGDYEEELHNVIVTGPDGKTNKTYANMQDGGLCGTEEAAAVWLYANGVLTIKPWVASQEKEEYYSNPKQEPLLMKMNDWQRGAYTEDELTAARAQGEEAVSSLKAAAPPWSEYRTRIMKVILDREYCRGFRIGSYAFANLPALETVEWEDGIGFETVIGAHAFENDKSLTDVPGFLNLTELGDYAFAGCIALREIVFAGNVPEAGNEVFHGDTLKICASGRYADTIGELKAYSSESDITVQLTDSFCGENVTWEIDPSGTLVISGTGAMADYEDAQDAPWAYAAKYISKIRIEDNVTVIGANAFAACSSWDGNVIISPDVDLIKSNAFAAKPAGIVTFLGKCPEFEAENGYEEDIFIIDEKTRFALPIDYQDRGWEKDPMPQFPIGAMEIQGNVEYQDMWIYAADDYRCSPRTVYYNESDSWTVYNGTATWELHLDGRMIIRGEGSITCGWDDAYKPLITKVFTEEGITSLGSDTFTDCPNLTYVKTYAQYTSFGVFRGSDHIEDIDLNGDIIWDDDNEHLFIRNGMLCSSYYYQQEKFSSIVYVFPNKADEIDLRYAYTGINVDLGLFANRPNIKRLKVSRYMYLTFSGNGNNTDLSSEVTFTVVGQEASPAQRFCEEHNISFEIDTDFDWHTTLDNYTFIPEPFMLRNGSRIEPGQTQVLPGRGFSTPDEEEDDVYRDVCFQFSPSEPGKYRLFMKQYDETAEPSGTYGIFRLFRITEDDTVEQIARSNSVTVIDPNASGSVEDAFETYAYVDIELEADETVYLFSYYNSAYSVRVGADLIGNEDVTLGTPEITGICGEMVQKTEYGQIREGSYRCSARAGSTISITQPVFAADGPIFFYWASRGVDYSASAGTDTYRIDDFNEPRTIYSSIYYGTLDGGTKLMERDSCSIEIDLIGGSGADNAVPIRHTEYFGCFGMDDNDGLDMYVGESSIDPDVGEVWFSFTPYLSGTYYLRSGYAEYENDELTVDPYGEIVDAEGTVLEGSDGTPLQNDTRPQDKGRSSCESHETTSRNRNDGDCFATFDDDFYIEAHLEGGTTYYIRCSDKLNGSGNPVPVRLYMFRTYDYTKEYSWPFSNSRASFGYTDGVENFDFRPYRRVWGNTVFAQQCYKDWKDRQWSGNCFGMSAAAMLLRDVGSGIAPADFGAEAGNVNELSLASRSSMGSAGDGMMVQELIEMMQVVQFSPGIQAILEKNRNDPYGLLAAMETAQSRGEPLLIAWYGKNWGHAVIGYRLEESNLYIVDPNFSGFGCHLLNVAGYNTEPMGWELSNGATNDSVYSIGQSISYVPYSAIKDIWDNRSQVKNGDQDYLRVRRSDTLSIYCGSVLVGSVENGVFTKAPQADGSGADDIFQLRFMDGNGEQDDIAYICVPADGEYRIEQNGVSTAGSMDVALMNDDRVVAVETQADVVTLKASDGSDECYAKIEGKENDTYSVSIADGSAGEDAKKEITLEGAAESSANSQQEAVVLDASGGTVKTANAGGATLSENGKTTMIPSDKRPSSDQTKQKAFISVNAKTVKLKKGQTTTGLIVSMADWDSVKSVKAAKKGIVKVSVKDAKKGIIKLKGKKTGSSKVTITLQSGLSVTIKVKVQKKKVAAKKVLVSSAASNSKTVADALNGKILKLKKGQSFKLKVLLDPFTAQDKITYRSSKPKVAAVTKKGFVKAKKAGKAKITIRAGKKKKVLTVVVK